MKQLLVVSALLITAASLASCEHENQTSRELAFASYEDGRYLDTRIHLSNALDDAPDHPELRELQGRTMLAIGDGQSAEFALREALKAGAEQGAVQPLLAHAYLLQGRHKEALELLAEAPAEDDHTVRLLAQAKLSTGQLDEAWTIIEQALSEGADGSDLLALAGQYQLSVGNLSEARRFADRALSQEKPSVEAYLLKGRTLSILSDREAALAQYEKAILAFPDVSRLHLAKAAIHADLGETDKLNDALFEVDRIDPGHPGAKYITARYAFNQGDYDQAYELIRSFEGKSFQSPPLLLLLGKIQMQRGNTHQGISHLESYLRFSPQDPTASLLLANALEKTGEVDEAFSVISAAAARASSPKPIVKYAAHLARATGSENEAELARRAKSPSLNSIRRELTKAQSASKSGDWQTASEVYNGLLSLEFTDHPLLLNNAAITNLNAGEGAKALALARRAYELAPNDPSVLDTVGWVGLNTTADQNDSLRLIRAAFRSDPGNMQIRFHLAQALVATGARHEAKLHFERLASVVDQQQREALEAVIAQL